jgi:hypothetical protein
MWRPSERLTVILYTAAVHWKSESERGRVDMNGYRGQSSCRNAAPSRACNQWRRRLEGIGSLKGASTTDTLHFNEACLQTWFRVKP